MAPERPGINIPREPTFSRHWAHEVPTGPNQSQRLAKAPYNGTTIDLEYQLCVRIEKIRKLAADLDF